MTLRSLEELNHDFISRSPIGEQKAKLELSQKKKKKRGLFFIILDVLFFIEVVMILFSIMISDSDNGAPKTFFDYSYFTVLTSSMQDEIPQDSLILVKKTDPRELNIGDNITYMTDVIERNMPVTHKIIDIYKDYDGNGTIGFQTKGVNNANADKDILCEDNVVGKVILVIPAAGAILSYLSKNTILVFLIFGVCLVVSLIFRTIFTKTDKTLE